MLYLPGSLQTSKMESFATKPAIVRVINYCCNSSPSEMFPEHCVKSVQIQSYFWSVFSCIRIDYNSVFRHFSRSGGPGCASTFRSSRPGVFCKKGILKNIVKFTGKHLHLSLFFNKAGGCFSTLMKRKNSSEEEF